MGVFERFERRLERLVEGTFAKVFHSEAEPADIAHALQRETDDRRVVVGAGRVIAPSAFVVELGDHDHARLAPYAEPLSDAFAEMLQDHAREQGYSFAGPIRVVLEHDPSLDTGRFQVRSDQSSRAAQPGPEPAVTPAGQPGQLLTPAPTVLAPAPTPVSTVTTQATRPARHHVIVTDKSATNDDGSVPDQERNVVITGRVTVVGRGAGADLRLDDPGVSRRHAELRLENDAVRIVDTGSTNGTTVNGAPVAMRELRDGDRIEVGHTVLVYRQAD